MKKVKGHSTKKRHGIGVPAGGVGKKKDERKKKPPKADPIVCTLGHETTLVTVVHGTGVKHVKRWCKECDCLT